MSEHWTKKWSAPKEILEEWDRLLAQGDDEYLAPSIPSLTYWFRGLLNFLAAPQVVNVSAFYQEYQEKVDEFAELIVEADQRRAKHANKLTVLAQETDRRLIDLEKRIPAAEELVRELEWKKADQNMRGFVDLRGAASLGAHQDIPTERSRLETHPFHSDHLHLSREHLQCLSEGTPVTVGALEIHPPEDGLEPPNCNVELAQLRSDLEGLKISHQRLARACHNEQLIGDEDPIRVYDIVRELVARVVKLEDAAEVDSDPDAEFCEECGRVL